MKTALGLLKDARCETAYIGGSFVTKKSRPKDFDGCWDETTVDWTRLDPIFLPHRLPPLGLLMIDKAGQWQRFRGEFYPAGAIAAGAGCSYLDFFQRDKEDVPRGIIRFSLRDLT